MKKVLIATLAFALMTSAALANDHGGSGGGPGGPGGHEGRGFDAGRPIVGADGSVFVIRDIVDNAAGTFSTQVTAVRPAGTVAWTVSVAGRHELVLSGSNLISVSETTATDGTMSSTLTAIATSTGATAWTRTIAGRVASLEPFSGGTYALVVTPTATTGGTATRSLVAIGNDGSVLWTVSLL